MVTLKHLVSTYNKTGLMKGLFRFLLAIISIAILACETSLEPTGEGNGAFDCSNFTYSDTIFYINEILDNCINTANSLLAINGVP